MKTKIAFILVFLMVFQLISFCNAETYKEVNKLQLSGDYSKDFDLVLAEITKLGDDADIVASINTVVWQAAGPSSAMMALSVLLEVGEKGKTDDVLWYSLYSSKYGEAFGSYSDGVIITYAKQYYKAYTQLSTNLELVKEYVKDLKTKYTEKSDAINALKNYYIKASAYADFAMNPTGNLLSYHSNHETFEKEMDELKIDAEFEK